MAGFEYKTMCIESKSSDEILPRLEYSLTEKGFCDFYFTEYPRIVRYFPQN